MPFEKKVQLNYNNLSESTKLRFMELEIQSAIELLQTTLFSSQHTPGSYTRQMIASYLVANPTQEMLIQELITAFNSHRFNRPTKEERIQYFRYKRIGVAKVAKYARVAPNTVQELKDSYPYFTPVFPSWLGFKQLVINWENLKNVFNLFDDDLIQAKDNHLIELNQLQEAPEK